jgi:hypothetical protein
VDPAADAELGATRALEQPLRGVQSLLTQAFEKLGRKEQRKGEGNDFAAGFCKDVAELMAKQPFVRASRDAEVASMDEVAQLIAYPRGALYTQLLPRLSDAAVLSGDVILPRRGDGARLSDGAATWLRRASELSQAMFPRGAPAGTIELFVAPLLSETEPRMSITIGDRAGEFSLSNPEPQRFVWDFGRDARIQVRRVVGNDVILEGGPGVLMSFFNQGARLSGDTLRHRDPPLAFLVSLNAAGRNFVTGRTAAALRTCPAEWLK